MCYNQTDSRGDESDPRNKGLMKMFNLINIGERAGSGVPDVFRTWEEQGWEEPVIEERYGDAARTKLILSFSKKQAKWNKDLAKTKKSIENKRKILVFLAKRGTCKTSEIALMLSLSESRTRAILKELIAEGKITSSGETKNKRYFLP